MTSLHRPARYGPAAAWGRALDDIEVGDGRVRGLTERPAPAGTRVGPPIGVIAGSDTEFGRSKRVIAGSDTESAPGPAPTPRSLTLRDVGGPRT